MKKYNRDKYFEDLEKAISGLSYAGKDEMEFARYFLNKMGLYDMDGSRVYFGGMDVRTLQSLVLIIVLEYKSKNWMS